MHLAEAEGKKDRECGCLRGRGWFGEKVQIRVADDAKNIEEIFLPDIVLFFAIDHR